MGTFTIETGLGLLVCGLVLIAVMGLGALYVINKVKDED